MKVSYVDIGGQYKSHREELLATVDRVLSSGQYILGDEVEKFERRFAEVCGAKFAVAVANGTDSLILAMKALGIKAGDEVITAPNSWISSASSVALIGAKPVFVDVLPDQMIDPVAVRKAVTARTKAILPVHLTGKIADMNPLMEIADKAGIPVIEDAAQAVGAKYFGKAAGTIGKVGSFSLHPLKNLNACGDAGILTTDDANLASELRLLRHHGLVDRNTVAKWGYNSRLDALQAALLNVRLDHLEEITRKRRANASYYRSQLVNVVTCPNDQEGCFDVYHTFVIQADRRDALKEFLASKGIDTAIHYPVPIHLQPAARELGYAKGSFPVTEKQSERILSLPVHQNLDEAALAYVVKNIQAFYA